MGLRIALFCIGAIFSPLAALAAFLIAYNEYEHHYPNKRQAFKAAIGTGIFTFIFFFILVLILAIVLPSLYST